MKLRFPLHHTRLSDREYIERIRRLVVLSERARRWLLLLYVVLCVGLIWMVTKGIQMLLVIVPPGNGPMGFLGFAAGLVLGSVFGLMTHHVAIGLVKLLFPDNDCRMERLLLKYHDAILALARDGTLVGQEKLNAEGEVQVT